MSGPYKAAIGLEIHVELNTATKIFCHCATDFGKEPNHNVCPVCLGLPGALPVLNQAVLEKALLLAEALHCEIPQRSGFDRKNYFYPDLPKGYQITQNQYPIGRGGYVEIEDPDSDEKKRIQLKQIHMEEDAGKLTYASAEEDIQIDYNRAGVPLIEIVTQPQITSGKQAKAVMEQIRSMVEYLEISDGKMEQGSLRCDVNISIAAVDAEVLGQKIELKNLNSLKAVEKATEYEILRQTENLSKGEPIEAQTRGWDENKRQTYLMRKKETTADYRYFPEPDLPYFTITEEMRDKAKRNQPEFAKEKRRRFLQAYPLTQEEVRILTASRAMAEYFEHTVHCGADAKQAASWILGELLSKCNVWEIKGIKVTPQQFSELLLLQSQGVINQTVAKKIFAEMYQTGVDAAKIVARDHLEQIGDEAVLREIVEATLLKFPQSIADYHHGKKKALGYMIGAVMKETKGKANPQIVEKLLRKYLDDGEGSV